MSVKAIGISEIKTTVLILLQTAFLIILSFLVGVDASAEETTLRFYSPSNEKTGFFVPAIKIFEARYPGVKVEWEQGPSALDGYDQRLSDRILQDEKTPDVFLMDAVSPPTLAEAGALRPLDELFRGNNRNLFSAGAISACEYKGHIYGTPAWNDCSVLYYRRDLLARLKLTVPKTWDQMVRVGEKFMKSRQENEPIKQVYLTQLRQGPELVKVMQELIVSNGGALFSADGKRCLIDRNAALSVVEFARNDLTGAGYKWSLTCDETRSLALFINGKAPFLRGYGHSWRIIQNEKVSKVAGNVGIASLPRFPSGQSVSSLANRFYGVSSKTRHIRQCRQFVTFMTSPDMQKLFVRKTASPPMFASLKDDESLLLINPFLSKQYNLHTLFRYQPNYLSISH